MDVIDALKARKSIRGYLSRPVPRHILEEILKVAGNAPSSVNIQPWHFTVIGGEVLENINRDTMLCFDAGVPPHPDVDQVKFTGAYRARQIAVAVQLYKLAGIARGEEEKRTAWRRRGIRYFDAPAAIIISADSNLGESALFDIGAVTQSIALAALQHGLGTCIQRQGVSYPEIIREYTGIPDSQRVVISLSIGYPDPDFPPNAIRADRESLENTTTWCGI